MRKSVSKEVGEKISKVLKEGYRTGKYIPPWKGKKLSDEHKRNISKGGKGRKFSEETKQKISIKMRGKNNPMWKGDEVNLVSLHEWVKRYKPKPKLCVICKKKPPFDLANISGEYKRDVNDFMWICRKCHMENDGRLDELVLNSKSEHFRKELSIKRKGERNPMYGKTPWLGRHHSEETKKKISLAKKGKN